LIRWIDGPVFRNEPQSISKRLLDLPAVNVMRKQSPSSLSRNMQILAETFVFMN
jgi:hypothetical protein